MSTVLDLISGICWSLAYTAAIILGIKHRNWFFPKLAICQNFSWELLVVINRLRIGAVGSVAFVIQFTWLLLDIGILATWLIFDRNGSRRWINNIALLLAVIAIMYTLAYHYEKWEIAAFMINAVMSGAFVFRAVRDNSQWTSRFIAVTKMIGTLAATILNGVILWNPFILWLGGLCCLLDVYYIVVLLSKQ